VVLDRVFGYRPDSLFLIYSASKPFVALAVHLLAQRGQLRLDDPVAVYRPRYAQHGKQAITVRHVLAHRAGVPLAGSLLRTIRSMTDWAGTAAVVRAALSLDRPTELTRSFTGRAARGIRNRFMVEHADAPPAYPELHHLTAPLRQAGRASNDPEVVNLWAGEAYPLAGEVPELPAAELVHRLYRDAGQAAAHAVDRLGRGGD
jgi:Beta-lactamase/Nitronate monooxygenase